MNKYFNLIYLIITFILVIIFGFFLTALFLPNPSKIKILSKNIVNTPTIKSYLENTYNSGYDANPSPSPAPSPAPAPAPSPAPSSHPSQFINDIVNYKFYDHTAALNPQPQPLATYIKSAFKYFNFFYEIAPDNLLNAFETAKNTSIVWPPKYNEKHRLLAFPYVSGNIFTGLYQYLAAKSSVATMPCWYICKYDSTNYNNSLYNKIFDTKYKIAKNKGHLIEYKLFTTFFGNVVEYETKENVFNKDGSSYRESHLLKYKTGGYTLENHLNPKVRKSSIYLEVQHTCFPLPGTDYPFCDDGGWWTYLSVGSGIWWEAKNPIIAKNKLHLLYCCGWTIDQFVDITENFRGGYSLIDAILTGIYNDEHPKNHKPGKGLALRTMEGNNGDTVVSKFFINFILFLAIILYLLILICINIYKIFKNLNSKDAIILRTLYISIFIIIIFTLLWYFTYICIDDFFQGLGWMTLDMALKKTKLTPYQFFEEAIFGTNNNPICNGLNMTEWFDGFLYKAVSNKKFTSAIMTMQPNKSGCWMVEMFDITKEELDALEHHPILLAQAEAHWKLAQRRDSACIIHLDEVRKNMKAASVSFEEAGIDESAFVELRDQAA